MQTPTRQIFLADLPRLGNSLFDSSLFRSFDGSVLLATLCTLALLAASPALASNSPSDAPRADRAGLEKPSDKSHDVGPRWVGVLRPWIAEDENPDPDILEVTLVAQESEVQIRPGGPAIPMWTYNGVYPGPMIDAVLGDRLIVHFYNQLPEATSIHWHGVALPAAMDGSELAQAPVEPGGYARYEFDLDRAATFWYRPGVRSGRQIEKGLQGALVVRAPWAEDEVLELPIWDHVLVFDDLAVSHLGVPDEIPPTNPGALAEYLANGLEGNRLLVNGQSEPTGMILGGRPHRLRLINASNGRFARFGIDGHPFWRLGGDAGLLPSPLELPAVTTDPATGESSGGVVLAPGERADVVFVPEAPIVRLRWHDVVRGRQVPGTATVDGSFDMVTAADDGRRPSQLLATLHVIGLKSEGSAHLGRADSVGKYYGPGVWPHLDESWEPRQVLRPLEALEPGDAPAIRIDLGSSGPDGAGNIEFHAQVVDGVGVPFDQITADEAPETVIGEPRLFEVVNHTASDEVFHLHGFRFRLIETEWVDLDDPEGNRIEGAATQEEKDTIRVPRRPGSADRSYTVVRLVVDLDDQGREGEALAFGGAPGLLTESGGWLFGSALPEHAENGMASYLQVIEAGSGN